MSVDQGFIQVSPSLQHRAAVRIIETLLRDPEYESMMIKASWNLREYFFGTYDKEKELDKIIEHLETRVNTLSVPEALKTTLKRCILYMTMSTVQWLVRVDNTNPFELQDQYWNETIYELMRHLQWNPFGYVDSQKTLESYISNRETIDFLIWNQLCLHCMEHEIRRFSETMEWNKCRRVFSTALSVYWYQKIHNYSPGTRMFQYEVEDEMWVLGNFEEKTLLEHMFSPGSLHIFPEEGMTVSGIKYFRNHLNDETKFVEMLQPICFGDANDDVIFYLLRTLKANDIFRIFPNREGKDVPLGLIDPLFQLPLILFIEDWMSMLETLDINWFHHFITAFTKFRLKIRYDYKDKLWEAFKKVWRIYYGKYSLDREEMGKTFWEIFDKKDVDLCNLMLKELEDHQRTHLIECAKDYREQHTRPTDDTDFLLQVVDMFHNDMLGS